MKMKSIIRRLTPTECMRLQGFDDDWCKIDGPTTPDSPQYKCAGNSQSTQVVEWLSSRAERVMRETGIVCTNRAIEYATCCSGIEAQSVGVRNMAWNLNFLSEIEKFPCRVLASRFPHVKNLGDMSKIDATKYRLDVMCGGCPCQDYSVAGKRAGSFDPSLHGGEIKTRSSLAFHLIRIAKESLVPGGIMIYENVPGMLSSNGGRDFAWFLHRIVESGMCCAWRTLDTQHVFSYSYPRAIPQRRRRVWLVAFNGDDWTMPARILFERSSRLGDVRPTRVLNDGTVVDDPKTASVPMDDLFSFAANAPHFTRASRADMIPVDLMPAQFGGAAANWLRDCGDVRYYGSFWANESEASAPDNLNAYLLKAIGAGAGVAFGNRIVSFKTKEWTAGIQMPYGVTDVPRAFDGTVCGLSDVLLPWGDYLGKYLLSKLACEGILRREEKCGKELPAVLKDALGVQIGAWTEGALDRYLKREGARGGRRCGGR